MQYIRHKNQWYIGTLSLVLTLMVTTTWGYNHFKEPVFPELNSWGIPERFGQNAIETDSVTQRFTVQQLLEQRGLSTDKARAVQKMLDVNNVRASIRPGSRIQWIRDSGVEEVAPAYLTFEPDYKRKAIVNLQDTTVSLLHKTPKLQYDVASGIINHSLYMTVENLDMPLSVVDDLSAIFAWEIDFYKLERGDRFKVIYQKKSYSGIQTNEGELVAALFVHNNTPYYAFRFYQNNSWNYYNEEGDPLKKAFLRAPLEYQRISSHYSRDRYHPVLKRRVPHLGTDYAAPEGTPIRAVGEGEVLMAGYSSKSGLNIKIVHNDTYATGYLHMSRIASGIEPGTNVVQGEVIGYVGSTGLATGPHLCFRFWKDGRQVDPHDENIASMPGITSGSQELFDFYTKRLKSALDTLNYPSNRQILAEASR